MQRNRLFLLSLPKRMIDATWRTKRYIEFRAGMPDPAKQARLERMRQLTRRR